MGKSIEVSVVTGTVFDDAMDAAPIYVYFDYSRGSSDEPDELAPVNVCS